MTIDFNSLPKELHVYIASFLAAKDLARLGACSKDLREISMTESLWQLLAKKMHLHPLRTSTYRQQVISAFIETSISDRISTLIKQCKFVDARKVVDEYPDLADRQRAHQIINIHASRVHRRNWG